MVDIANETWIKIMLLNVNERTLRAKWFIDQSEIKGFQLISETGEKIGSFRKKGKLWSANGIRFDDEKDAANLVIEQWSAATSEKAVNVEKFLNLDPRVKEWGQGKICLSWIEKSVIERDMHLFIERRFKEHLKLGSKGEWGASFSTGDVVIIVHRFRLNYFVKNSECVLRNSQPVLIEMTKNASGEKESHHLEVKEILGVGLDSVLKRVKRLV